MMLSAAFMSHKGFTSRAVRRRLLRYFPITGNFTSISCPYNVEGDKCCRYKFSELLLPEFIFPAGKLGYILAKEIFPDKINP